MSVSVTMPALGESVTEGTVTRWLKQVGDMVQADEPLLEVSTDKVDTEIPSPATGVLLSISVGEDETIAVGAELAVIGEASEPTGDATPAPAAPAGAPIAAPESLDSASAAPSDSAPASPIPAEDSEAAPASGGSTVAITLPALGESVTEGTVTRWLKQVGDTVAADEPILEISTDKVDTEIPSPAAGTLVAINVAEDETVAVGTELGLIATGSAAASSAPAAAPAAPAVAAAAVPEAVAASAVPAPAPVTPDLQPATAEPVSASVDNADAYVTPLVRRLAAQEGIDLSTVIGTGVGGRVRKQDVLAAAAGRSAAPASSAPAPASVPTTAPSAPAATASAKTPAPAEVSPLRGRTEKMPRLRKVIAERMVESLQTSAQLTTVIEVDVTGISRLRSTVKANFEAREGVKLSFLPFFCKAAVEALKQYPQVNASIDMAAGTVTYHDHENLGIAVETDRGLLVPVIRDAGELNIAGLARRISDVADRTRTNKVAPDELSGGTFTVTNTGSRGALFDTPIINQPQVAILGTGAVVKRPIVVTDASGQDVIAIRSMVYLALSYDHRLVDGA
ncbi:MAG: 2-oxoglutarate dehydrogenase, E2 component, dihydrolipoamide succinyltransferase, partial [Actinobacteria bacterium]|nr:2-oxoglutarate dehydrogenase, E2 component, dihydrolipoamide succinyltransferase [Actinomycetota bacterium]